MATSFFEVFQMILLNTNSPIQGLISFRLIVTKICDISFPKCISSTDRFVNKFTSKLITVFTISAKCEECLTCGLIFPSSCWIIFSRNGRSTFVNVLSKIYKHENTIAVVTLLINFTSDYRSTDDHCCGTFSYCYTIFNHSVIFTNYNKLPIHFEKIQLTIITLSFLRVLFKRIFSKLV